MSFQLVSSILAGQWFINRTWANSYLPLVLAVLKGQDVSFVQRSGNEGVEQPFVIDPYSMDRYNLYNDMDLPNPAIPPNSVGIIPITGPLTQYNGGCGEPGMIQRTNWLIEMQRRDHICSVVQILDTPGGESRAAHGYCSVLAKSKKPVLSYVDTMCASLGMWFSSGSKEVYFSHDLAEMGSIGTYVMLADWTGWLEKEGIKMHEIYAPQSTDKNKNYNDALKGDYTLIQEDLKKHVDAFINYVQVQRGEKAAANVKKWDSGKMFYAKDAIKLGLADGVMHLNQVIAKAVWLAKQKRT